MTGIDDDLEDLIEGEIGIDWPYVRSKIPEMSTEELLELMVGLELFVNKYLAREIAKREDAVFWLRRLLQNGIHWRNDGPGDAWSPIHAIHILAMIKGETAMDLLLDTLRYNGDNLGYWLTEEVPSLLYSFGVETIDRQMEFTSDETLEAFVRGAAISSLTALVREAPSSNDNLKELLLRLLDSSIDDTVATMAADGLTSFRDQSVLPHIRKAYEQDRIDPIHCPMDELEAAIQGEFGTMDEWEFTRNTRDPIEHFSRKNIEYLWGLQDDPFPDDEPELPYVRPVKKKKIGRNEPCPCGSGIKYKKCCGKIG